MSEHPTPHTEVRELLGSFVLGALEPPELDEVREHLAGCPRCRAEVEELTSVRTRLDLLGADEPEPPSDPTPDLGERIEQQVRREQQLRDRRRRRRPVLAGLAAAAAAVLIAGVGFGVGRSTAPVPPPPPLEAVDLDPVRGADIQIEEAAVIAHTWGIELRFTGTGFAAGRTFRAVFVRSDGARVPGGQFVGTGANQMSCNLQSSPLREDVVAVILVNADRVPVARAAL